MAKQRVQVQDLPEAPSLQPTVQSGGQYNIAVRQAGRNSLLDLADTLKQVNPALKTYGALQDLDTENFKKELQRLSPEERRKLVTQERDEMDKLVRKNVIPFMGNAWNWKRKSRAIGALMHDEFQRSLQDNFENPEHAELSSDQVVRMTQETMEDEYDVLKSDTYAREGFQEAINPTAQKYSLHYDKAKNDAARLQIKEASVAKLFRDSTGTINHADVYAEWEDIQGSQKPEALINIIETVARQHASIGNKEDALEWLQWASGHLKVGTSIMGDKTTKEDDVYGLYSNRVAMLEEEIERIDERRGNDLKRDAEKELNALDDDIFDAALAVKNGGIAFITLEDGAIVTLTSEDEVRDYYQQVLSKSENPYAKSAYGLDVINKTLASMSIPGSEAARFRGIHNQSHAVPWSQMLSLVEQTENSVIATEIDVMTNKAVPTDPDLRSKLGALNFKYNAMRDDKLQELSTGKYKDIKGVDVMSRDWQSQVTNDLRDWEVSFQKDYQKEVKETIRDFNKTQDVHEIKGDVSEVEDETKSLIDPAQEIDDVTSGITERVNIYDIERAVRSGELTEASKLRKKFEAGGYNSSLFEMLNTLDNAETTQSDREKASRGVLFYLMSNPRTVFTAKNIKKGNVIITQEGGLQRLVSFRDKKAIQAVMGVFPILSHSRIAEIHRLQQSNPDVDVKDVEDLLKAIYDTKDVTPRQVNAFIKQQNALHARFK